MAATLSNSNLGTMLDECMHRCLDAFPSSRGFFVRNSDTACACSTSTCEHIDSHSGFTSYGIQVSVENQDCQLFTRTNNEFERPIGAMTCTNCTLPGPESQCYDWTYIEPSDVSSSWNRDYSWDCETQYDGVPMACTKCTSDACLEISCPNGFSNPNRNVTDGCEATCDEGCYICDQYDPTKCIQKNLRSREIHV